MDTTQDSQKSIERREKPRKSSGSRVWADPGGVLPVIDCKILDISDEGAHVAALNGRPLPEKFILQHEAQRILGEAHVIWRNGVSVGVKLIKL